MLIQTIFLHLSDVEDGGETVFTKVDRPDTMVSNTSESLLMSAMESSGIEENSWEHKMVKQCRTQFSVKPHKGDALLFYSQAPDGALDERSFHGGCPVLGGTKWAGNVWVWNGCRYGICKNLPENK
jgi:prolyl 4-hydroxylase